MNFEDEEYVRLYCKDTVTVRKIGWEGRLVLWEIMRKVDLAGVLDLQAEDDEVEAVASLIGVPEEIVRVGLERLASRGVTSHHGPNLVVTRFVEAQNAKRSDRLRAQEYRDRKRLETLAASNAQSQSAEESDAASQGVTNNNESSRTVTIRHSLPCPALPPPAPPRPADVRVPVAGQVSSGKRQELSLQLAAPEDAEIFEAWREKFKMPDAHFTADRALPLRQRRAEDMTQQDALDALAGAATDDWFTRQGRKLKLVFSDRERFETYRNVGRDLRAGRPPPAANSPPPRRGNAPLQSSHGQTGFEGTTGQ